MPKILKQFAAIWSRLETPQKATVILAALGLAVVLGLAGWASTRPDFSVLASDLSKGQAYKIAAELDSLGIPYRIADNETTVLVPSAKRYSLRNDLAEKELLGDGSHGFELLDKTGFGESTFAEHKRFDRAVAGELERSFCELPGVRSARVILVQPPPSPFLDDERKASASVKLDMEPGRRLTDRQVAGVIRLATGSVEGLTPDRVQVMDNQGLLSRDDADPGAAAAGTRLEAEQATERHLARKAQELLDRVLGPGRSLVTVSVDLDFTRRSEAVSDPTTSVLLRTTTGSTTESTPIPDAAGVAGTASNVEAAGGKKGAVRTASKGSEDETKEFVVGKRTATREDEVGLIRGMNVGILLDHKSVEKKSKGADGAEKTETVREEYSEAERQRFADLVLQAVGFQAAKGAQQAIDPKADVSSRFAYSVASLPVQTAAAPVEAQSAGLMPQMLEHAGTWGRWLLAGVLGLGLLMVARGQLKRSHAAWQSEQERARHEENQRQVAASQPDPASEAMEQSRKRTELRDRVREDVGRDPKLAAQMLKGWIHDA